MSRVKVMVKQMVILVMVTLAKSQDLSCPKGSPVKSENFYVIGASGGDCKVGVIHPSLSLSYNCHQLPHLIFIVITWMVLIVPINRWLAKIQRRQQEVAWRQG